MRASTRWFPLITLTLGGCVAQYSLFELPDDAGEPEVAADTAEPAPSPAEETPPATDTAEPVVDEDPAPADDCDHTSDLVYTINREDESLYLFDPTTGDLNFLARLDCPTTAVPGSMAVSRDGHAYVRYDNNKVYDIDLQTFACTPTDYANARTGFGPFGMGFVADVAGGWREHLFVANFFDLARLDTGSWQLDAVGAVPSQPEITGTADGELWMFLPLQQPAEIRRVDPTTGAKLASMRLTDFPDPVNIDAFAFAGWGGSFWLFVREYGVNRTTDIYEVQPGPVMTLVRRNVGLEIVGAGVSTCAPTGAVP